MPLTRAKFPVRLTPLVGRERELGAIADALTRSRLLVLTGPGGTGKTRLALAAAMSAEASFPDGVCWVELAQIDDPGIVGQAVASRLEVPDTPGQDPAEAVAEYIGEHRVLVVLDNCEHLAGETAKLAENLLWACPALVVLATSREALRVEGEVNWRVPPLSLPAAGRAATAAALVSSAAVKLFEQRAQLVRPSFRVTDDNAAKVASICQRLDGLPLAIELAAARMRMLSSAQLAERLDDMFAVLVGGARSAPPRHQALHATLDWSHHLLDAYERVTFRRLAVFYGGFTMEAAEQVAAGGEISGDAMLELVTRLADKSLLRVDDAHGDSRYQLLATIREYAAERLAEAGEEDQVRRAHLNHYMELAERSADRIEPIEVGGPDPGAGSGAIAGSGAAAGQLERQLDRLDAELPNLRRAFEYASETGEAVAALRIAGALGRYAYLRGRYQELRQWMDAAVTAAPDASAALRARALLGSGRLALLQCDYAPAARRLEDALRLYRELGDAKGIARALQVLGSVAREQGRYKRAAELYEEGLAVARAAGDRWGVASAHDYLAFASWLQCDFGRAADEASTALAAFRELGDIEGLAWSLISSGVAARYEGDAERATELLIESRSLSEGVGFREGIAYADEQLGLLAAARGAAAAVPLLRHSLKLHTELRDRWRMSSVLEDLAAVALARGQPDAESGPAAAAAALTAARLLGAAEAIREAIGTTIAPCEREQHDKTDNRVRAVLGKSAFTAARRQGRITPLDELVAELAAPPTGAADARVDRKADEAIGLERAAGANGPADGTERQQAAGTEGAQQGVRARAGGRARTPRPRAQAERVPGERVLAGRLRIRALGGATVELGDTTLTTADWGYAKPRELMFLLACSPPMTKDQIATALWPDLSRQQLGNALHTALRDLRRALGDPGWVLYSDSRYRFDRSRPYECDVTTFEDALAAARRARPAESALPDLQRAIAAYGGDFMDGMAAGDWALVRRDELRRAFESTLLATGRLQAAAGRHQAAAAAFRRAVAHEPLNESAHRELMSSWARLGETARAVRHYEELVRLLRDQVGVPPAAETTALYRRLLAFQ